MTGRPLAGPPLPPRAGRAGGSAGRPLGSLRSKAGPRRLAQLTVPRSGPITVGPTFEPEPPFHGVNMDDKHLRWAARIAAPILALVAAPAGLGQEPAAPQSDGELRELIAEAGSQADNGGAHVVTVLWRTRVEVENSGLGHIHNREVIKCLSERGAAELARIRLDFDPASNLVEVRTLRILRADGVVQELPLTGVDLPQPQHGIYWGAQMKLVPLPRLNVGDAVEIRTYMKGFLIAYLEELEGAAHGAGAQGDERYIPPMRGHFYDVVYFHRDHPVKCRHYTVVTPRDKPVQFEIYNGEAQSYVSYDDEHLIYRFWRRDQPAYRQETRAVDAPDVMTKVVLATVPDWPAKSRWFCQVNAGQFEANAAIRAKVAEITRGLSTDEEKIAAIVHWSADEIRYSGVSMGKGEGYTLHPGPMIFHNRSGVCKDKAGIAITMLRAAGYTAWPAMTMAGSRVERVPADQFNHCVVALQRDDGSFLMLDPTWVVFSPEEWSSAEGEQNFVIGTPEGLELMQTPSFDPVDNQLQIEATAALDERGNLTGTVIFSGRGYADQRLRRELAHNTTSRDRQAWFQEQIGHIAPGARVGRVDVTYAEIRDVTTPVRYEVHYRIPGFAMVSGDRMYFSPPTARHLITRPSLAPYLECAGPAERTQNLLLWAPRMRSVTETIALPTAFRPIRLPEDRRIDGEVASLDTRLEPRANGLRYTYRLMIKRREIPVESYGAFREVVQEALALPDDLIVLERR